MPTRNSWEVYLCYYTCPVRSDQKRLVDIREGALSRPLSSFGHVAESVWLR